MKICGVDPGCSGALALLDESGNLLECEDMPTVKIKSGKTAKARLACGELVRLLREWAPDVVVIELVGGMPGQGAASSFQFGYAAGGLEGACAALGLSVQYTSPVVWKRAMKVTSDKETSRLLAMRRWPGSSKQFARKSDDGRAEAALIAEWSRLQRVQVAA